MSDQSVKVIESADLFFCEGTSNKEYHVQLVDLSGSYAVDFQYGRRGSALTTGRKIETPTLDQAKKTYDKVKIEKMSKGYHEEGGGSNQYAPATAVDSATKQDLILPQLLTAIEDSEVDKYLNSNDYGSQDKKDGRHQMIRVVDEVMTVYNRKGKQIGHPAVWSTDVTVKNVIIDGEAIGEQFHAFDLLETEGEDFRKRGYAQRHLRLSTLFKKGLLGGSIKIVPLACSPSDKKSLYAQLQRDKKEGIVFKNLLAPYTPGKGVDMLKNKFYAALTARVKQGRSGKHSVGLELLDGVTWVDVGNVTVAQSLVLPSPGSHVEIRFLYMYKGGSLYQPTYLGPRDDLDDSDCVLSQVKYKSEEE